MVCVAKAALSSPEQHWSSCTMKRAHQALKPPSRSLQCVPPFLLLNHMDTSDRALLQETWKCWEKKLDFCSSSITPHYGNCRLIFTVSGCSLEELHNFSCSVPSTDLSHDRWQDPSDLIHLTAVCLAHLVFILNCLQTHLTYLRWLSWMGPVTSWSCPSLELPGQT